jgi:anti-sigma regulatory factor (Ser/Thr protein kinase)
LSETIKLTYSISGDDFTRAGEASSDVKKKLKQMGVNPEAVRKVAISMYEGEINMVIHAHGGRIDVLISQTEIVMILQDHGPGIDNIDLAMQAGYSTCLSAPAVLWSEIGTGSMDNKAHSAKE